MMKLIIKVLSGETTSVQVDPNTTIDKLKQQIAPLFNARPSRLQLSINSGQILQLDQNNKMVRDYDLSSGSTVMMLISTVPVPFQVFVTNPGSQKKTYDITDEETVDQLMTKVSQKERIAKEQLRLIFNDKQLESGKDLQYYNIVPGSTIRTMLRLRGGD